MMVHFASQNTQPVADTPVVSGHTRGPWRWGFPSPNAPFAVYCPDNKSVARLAIARCSQRWAEGEANARLIAAAPDLLEACWEALDSELRRKNNGETYVVGVMDQLRAALLKATTGDSVGTKGEARSDPQNPTKRARQ